MYQIADMLIRIKNAQMVKAEEVSVPFSKIKLDILNILKSAGFISDVERKKKKFKKTEQDYLNIILKYQDGQGALNDVKIISKPSRRIYIKAEDIKPVRSGHGLAIVSTSRGIMNASDAKKQNLGGELICEVY